ncbi:ABCC3 [Branchiostoma lanceolatum]|uniref:ABCC3 protein n=1 Tax=Branchiostoma lanceolatum TaxID=7740 RepID=A0A8J9Z016_BRALA|nr:ABCC3 [Branchiostoma lanceolatum]
MEKTFKKPKPNPLEKAGLLSKLFFWWPNALFKIGYKRTLQEDDMYNILFEDSTQKQADDLEREWQKELDNAKGSPERPPSLRRAMARVFRVTILLSGLCFLFVDAVRMTQPVVLTWLIGYFSPESTVTATQAYLYASIISVCALVAPVIQHSSMFAIMKTGWRMRVACCGLIYRKALKLNHTALGKSNTGQIVNLMSNDVNRFDMGFQFFNYLWIGPLEILTVITLLYRDMGPPSLVGLGYIIFQLAISGRIGRLFSTYRGQIAQKTDDRIRTMSEIISAMRVIKMYAWEKPFSELVANLRKIEIGIIDKASIFRGLIMALSSVAGRLLIFFTVVTFALTGNDVTAGVVFRTVGLVNILQMSVFVFMPQGIALLSEAIVSIRRIQDFLLLEEADSEEAFGRTCSITPKEAEYSVMLNGIKAKWTGDSDQLTLKNINLKLKPGQLLAVIGPVGSGKSSLLNAVLRELPVTSGEVKVHGKVGYASQQPWVFSGTVRQNILFGRPYKEDTYDKTIQVCALEKDLELLPHGDMTLVGDRGVTLSGGQKARINLARAVYHDADIYLLDDPLSAVDAEVGQQLFNRLVPYSFSYGEQVATGTYSELQQSGIDFTKLLGKEESEEDRENVITAVAPALSGTSAHGYGANSIKAEADEKDATVPLLEEEHRMTGTVGWKVYRDYFAAGLGVKAYLFVKSSTNLHNGMFNAIIRAPIRFFDTNPVGRVLNRFSKDIGQLDEMFPAALTGFTQVGILALGTAAFVAGITNPWVFIPTLPLLLLFMYIRRYYLSTSRDIKRLEGTTRSPVFSHLSATLQGLWTIRAFGAQESFQQEFDAHQDLHSEAWFLYISCTKWMAVRLDILVALFITAVVFCSVLASQALDGGLVGLSVTYAILLTGRFQWVISQSAEVENLMTSAERVLTYTKLEPEAPLASSTKPPRDWPQDGGIELEDATFSYSEDGPDVLKNLGVVIQPQEKIGIVGRTGAGKSSLMQMLFRMAEPQGTVRIDGVDVTKIGLHDLRKKISVIPQDPVLFSGSLRRNLDPFNDFTDQQLWSVVEEVQLKQAVEDMQGKLESEMAESGTNFSVGQRQLVCLARALLRKNRILIIDEATANVDPRTDQLIQETIREKFKKCTVLTIAHRLNTVIDSDRIMASHSSLIVLQEGRVQEMGEAHALLQDRDGVFTAMVDQSGNTLAAELREAARRCYMEKHGTDQVSVDKFVSIVGRETRV